MDLRILGCFGGVLPGHRTTNFVVNDEVAIDAGALAFSLSFEEQLRIRHVFITHSHLDHTNSLPFLIDNVFGIIDHAVEVWSIAPVIDALKKHLFNNVTWPDFSVIPDAESSILRFHVIEPLVPVEVSGLRVTAVPVNHVVPTVGYHIEEGESSILFSSDTGPCPELYQFANASPTLKALITEVSFLNADQAIADISKHLTTNDLRRELQQLHRDDVEVLLYHLKPPFIDQIHDEIRSLGDSRVRCLDQDGLYRF